MEIKRIGIVGTGTMGCGIAQVAAQAGYEVHLIDVTDTLVNRAIQGIEANLAKHVEKGKLSSEGMQSALQLLRPTARIEDFHSDNIVIEAVFEDLKVKTELLRKFEACCSANTILASNTSTLSITEMASTLSRPGRFIGLHFFNPVPAMRLLEVIPGLQTNAETIDVCIVLGKALKKTPILVQDCPGFLVNRIFMPYAGEALMAVQEGAAAPADIDRSIKDAGFPMGPLALNDMVGLDVGLHTFPILYEGYGERFPLPVLLPRLVEAGRLGIKSGRGIYSDGHPDEEFLDIIAKIQADTGIRATEFSVDRLILRQVNEAIYCLQEKIATAEDIDRALVLGTGFPSDQRGVGGPLHWADEKGLDWVLDRLNHFRDEFGSRFWPHPLLKRYVAAGYLGKKVSRGFFNYQ